MEENNNGQNQENIYQSQPEHQENVYQSQPEHQENVYQSQPDGQNNAYQDYGYANGTYTYGQQGGAYQQNPNGTYNYSQYQNTQNQNAGNGFGIASMILGIVSLLLFCTCVNIPIAVTAIVFGILHLCRNTESKGYGIVGISTAALSIVAFVVTIVLLWTPFTRLIDTEVDSDYEYEYDMPMDGIHQDCRIERGER